MWKILVIFLILLQLNDYVAGCSSNADCSDNRACLNHVCTDFCIEFPICKGTTVCQMINHYPECKNIVSSLQVRSLDPCENISCGSLGVCQFANGETQCVCPSHMTGIFPNCKDERSVNPCANIKCGDFGVCQIINGFSQCSCSSQFPGNYPYCGGGCSSNADCSSNRACFNRACTDMCLGTNFCSANTLCEMIDHRPECKVKKQTLTPISG